MRSALAGRDTLALMPTGSGKSLPYQLAAMLRDSPTLVVSPLIALMKDQVDKLPPAVAAQASVVNSSLGPGEAAERLRLLRGRRREAPARGAGAAAAARRSSTALASARVGLVVVDEVHCVSMWGHDFRPDYLFIRAALAELGEPPVLGLTATATPDTEAEIGRALGREFEVVRASVVRPNLRHAVDAVDDEEDRRRQLLDAAARGGGPAIVYARSRKKCEELARLLRGHGVRRRALPRRARVGRADARAGGVRRRRGAGGRRDDRVRDGDRQARHPPRPALQPARARSRTTCRWSAAPGATATTSDCVLFAGRRDAGDLRRFARSRRAGARRPARRSTAGCGTRPSAASRASRPTSSPADGDGRVLVGMLEQAGLVRRGYDAGRAVEVRAARRRRRTRPSGWPTCSRAPSSGRSSASTGSSATPSPPGAGRSRSRSTSARAACADCGACDRCAPARAVGRRRVRGRAAELPEDVAGAILGAVRALRWPLGVGGLVAMLWRLRLGATVGAAQRRLRRARRRAAAAIKRWIGLLVGSGHLERYESDDGFPLLRAGPADEPPPRIAAAGAAAAAERTDRDADEALFERLRAWRRETAAADERARVRRPLRPDAAGDRRRAAGRRGRAGRRPRRRPGQARALRTGSARPDGGDPGLESPPSWSLRKRRAGPPPAPHPQAPPPRRARRARSCSARPRSRSGSSPRSRARSRSSTRRARPSAT